VSAASVLTEMIKSSPRLAYMSVNLFYLYFTLGSRVRKTRRAFEKQLVLAGMSEDDARRLSACFEELKNNITSVLKQSIVRVNKSE
jgi:cytochrome c553